MASTGVSITAPVLKRVSSWDVQTVDDGGESEDNVGQHTSIAFDPADGYPAIAYYNVSDFHSLGDGAGGHNIGQYISQDWKTGSSVGFAYYDATDGELIYTEYYLPLLMLSSVTVAEGDDMGKWADFKYKTYDDPRFSFYNDTDNDCQYAELAE